MYVWLLIMAFTIAFQFVISGSLCVRAGIGSTSKVVTASSVMSCVSFIFSFAQFCIATFMVALDCAYSCRHLSYYGKLQTDSYETLEDGHANNQVTVYTVLMSICIISMWLWHFLIGASHPLTVSPYGLADFFFSFSSFHHRKWHSRRPNTMKETLHWPGILEKPSYG